MEIYYKLFEVLFPVFFVVGIGYYLGKKNKKIDTTFITNFAANIGTPAMVIYAVTSTGINFNIFKDYFWYYLLAIMCFSIVGLVNLFLIKTRDIVRDLDLQAKISIRLCMLGISLVILPRKLRNPLKKKELEMISKELELIGIGTKITKISG